jgi:hypothetical protein
MSGSPDHQSAHWLEHKNICQEVVRTRFAFLRETGLLRADPNMSDDRLVGLWGQFSEDAATQYYMRARRTAAQALLNVGTRLAAEKALEYLTGMVELDSKNRSGVEKLVPSLFLRLGREEEYRDWINARALASKAHGLGSQLGPVADTQRHRRLLGKDLWKTRPTGAAFPFKYVPVFPHLTPEVLFPVTRHERNNNVWYLSFDQRQILLFVGG